MFGKVPQDLQNKVKQKNINEIQQMSHFLYKQINSNQIE